MAARMFDYSPLLTWMEKTPGFENWARTLPQQIEEGLSIQRWGDLPKWQNAIDNLPQLSPSSTDLLSQVRIGEPGDCSDEERQALRSTLMELHPWRKGPWQLFGLDIDTEWRSDWKWDRLASHLNSVKDGRILDVGCGNGYHCMRLYGAGAQRVIGIDPSAKFIYQFQAIKQYYSDVLVDILPLGIEKMPADLQCFDTVLSMGVIYHRKDPIAHIQELMACLKPGGQLVLETLVVEGDESLIPDSRYAKMRNVWCVPAVEECLQWMRDAGLRNPKMVDCTPTTIEEQRATEWMHFESLPDFLNPNNSSQTIEGYPAPVRAIFIADL